MRLTSIIFLTICLWGWSAGNSMAIDDTIIAVVNDDVITLSDFQSYMQSMFLELQTEGKSQEEIRSILSDFEKNGIERLIEDKIIMSAIKDKDLEVKEDSIDKKIEEIKAQYANEQVFLQALAENGSTITEIRKKIKERFQIEYIIQKEIKDKITVNPAEITEYYQKHIDQFKKPERLKLDSVHIARSADPQADREKAAAARKALIEGVPVQEVIAQYSQTASIGQISRGQLLTEIEDIIFQLEPGNISEPIETEAGIYIFVIKEKLPPESSAMEDVQETIHRKLFQEKFAQKYKEWIAKLKKDAYIEIKK